MEVEQLTGQELPELILFEVSTVRQLAKRLARTAGARRDLCRPLRMTVGLP